MDDISPTFMPILLRPIPATPEEALRSRFRSFFKDRLEFRDDLQFPRSPCGTLCGFQALQKEAVASPTEKSIHDGMVDQTFTCAVPGDLTKQIG